ncbi:hypothetical protein [Shewanella youngdeokensis]|uniref:DUF4148 domain-containing protein n=1 Tax=Shewanella youngdeokensis TaxID=2999068 RepID=A0ABZ0JWT9_9GAMM|nr:hypothetical protein RGE70_15695 [Shewanella sp. DAU334]
MKVLTSVALSLVVSLVSASAMAERPDFSKTAAARADYDFSQNVAAEPSNSISRSSSRHDFSKTTAALVEYKFSNNPTAKVQQAIRPATQHDFSKTLAASQSSF